MDFLSHKHFLILFSVLFIFNKQLRSQPETIGQLKTELRQTENDQRKASIYKNLISRYMRIDTDSMYYFAKNFLEFAESSSENQLRLEAYFHMGRYFAVKGESDQAIIYLQRAYEFRNISNDTDFVGQIVGMMGYVYYFDEQYATATKFYKEAISYFEQGDSKRSLSIAISTLGSIYFQQEDFESAKKQFQRSLSIKESLRDSVIMSTDITNLGLIYQREGKLDSALIYAEKALQIDESFNNIPGIADIYGDISSIKRMQGDYNEAVEYAEKSLEKSLEVNILPLIRDAYEIQYKAYEAKGNFNKALSYYIQFKSYSDSVINQESRNELAAAQTRFETEKKDRAIQLLEAENRSKKLQIAIIILIAFFGVILLSMFYWQTTKRKARERKLELQSVQNELSNYGILLAEKDALMSNIIEKLKELGSKLKTFEAKKEMSALLDILSQNIQLTEDENQLFQRIEQVNSGFFRELEDQFGSLTKNEKRLASLVQMELSNKEIGGILGINSRSVVQARYRLKKKINLRSEDDLVQFLKSIEK